MAIYKGFSTKSFNYSDPASIVGLSDNDFGPYNLNDKNLIIMDLISIIIPYYKKKHFVKQAVNSVLNQTYKNIEVILAEVALIFFAENVSELTLTEDPFNVIIF